MSLIDDDKINLDGESEDECLFDSEEQSKKVKFTYNGVPYTSLAEFLRIHEIGNQSIIDIRMNEYAKKYIIEHEKEASGEFSKDEECIRCLIRSTCRYINSDEPRSKRISLCNQTMDSYLKILRAETEIEKKSHELLHRETTEELDRTTSSETIFGYTEEEFDKMYEENNGFNETYPQDPNYLGVDFCKLMNDGSAAALERAKQYQEEEKGKSRTRKPEDSEEYGDWIKNI